MDDRRQRSTNEEHGQASGCWSLCLPRPRDDDRDIELNNVAVKRSDSTPAGPGPEPMPRAQPTWRTRQFFDPVAHLTLNATGLAVNYPAINSSPHSDEEIVRLLNHAKEFVGSRPLLLPMGFDPAKHAQQLPDGNWGPNTAGILGDNHLSDAEKIDVYRWAKTYQPRTRTDPNYVKAWAQTVVVMLLVVGGVSGAIYGLNQLPRPASCVDQPMSGPETEALLQSLRNRFPQLVNATLENMSEWYPTISANLTEPIYRDQNGNILETVCPSAARTLDPVLSVMVLFSLLAMQMLLQG